MAVSAVIAGLGLILLTALPEIIVVMMIALNGFAASFAIGVGGTGADAYFLRAAALPPLAPAFFFCAVVPPCSGLEPDPDFLPPRLEAPGLLAMRAARDFDMPFSFSFSYCLSFLTLADLDGI